MFVVFFLLHFPEMLMCFCYRNFAIAYATPYMVDANAANLQSKVFFIWGSFW
jgi:hypothetical protein